MHHDVWVWQIEPYEPVRDCPNYDEMREYIAHHIQVNPPTLDRCGDRYRIVSGHWQVLAARAVGLHRFRAIVVRGQ